MDSCIDHGFTTSLAPFGYHMVGRGGKVHAHHRLVFADRLGVPIEQLRGVKIRHTCDNPRCVNPDHLLAGTQADNMHDMAVRKRHVGYRKLTYEDAVAIRAQYIPRHREFSQSALARKYGVSRSAILNILQNCNWKAEDYY